MNQENNTFYGIGRRKQAIAQVLLKVGTGKLTINGKPGELYLQENITYLNKINNPFQVLGLENEYDVNIKATGGGLTGQKGYVGTGGGDSGGNGGTQSAGGTYPGSGGGSCTATSCAGTKLRGGTACGGAEGAGGVGWPNQVYGGTWASAAGGNGCNAGGGGGGYWGGSGGGGDPNGGCGGGGSSYIGGHTNYSVSNATAYQGNYETPNSAATSSTHYSSGISVGATYNQNNGGNGNHTGGHGKIVFVYLAP